MSPKKNAKPFAPSSQARDAFEEFKVAGERNLFVVGTFDSGVTILSQQVRALNLVWSLIEHGGIADDEDEPKRIAVVGAGFAGLTVAAGFLAKSAPVELTLFEKRDTVLPLQQGCDTRWVHPHIYDWPAPGTEAPTAGLPLLTWTASRASDVAVQVLRGWQEVLQSTPPQHDMRLYCNTKHLRITQVPRSRQLRVEWVGERRDTSRPTQDFGPHPAEGATRSFDAVILALGFGLESQSSVSYWRNETLAQPSLDEGLATYIVSGQGDAAMIDLLRLTIGEFRQDRILSELFSTRPSIYGSLQELSARVIGETNLFDDLERLVNDPASKVEADDVLVDLSNRIRRDTSVVLHLKKKNLVDLFAERRISFQNSLLVYLLYRCGAFYPSSVDLDDLVNSLSVPEERVIRRHGTARDDSIHSVLSGPLTRSLQTSISDKAGRRLQQPAEIRWPGGYFDSPFRLDSEVAERVKATWRKEYLPGATEAMVTAFCSAISGYLESFHASTSRLRVTLHRALPLGREVLLQQSSEYIGLQLDAETAVAGRTFPNDHGTIGEAFLTQKVVRSVPDATSGGIESDMRTLQLTKVSREMSDEVKAILAIPLVSVQERGTFVVAVLYADSEIQGFFSDDDRLSTILKMCERFMNEIKRVSGENLHSLTNYDFWSDGDVDVPRDEGPSPLPSLERSHMPPSAEDVPFLNFDYSDFVRVAP